MDDPPRQPVIRSGGGAACSVSQVRLTVSGMANASNLTTLMTQGIISESEVAQAVDAYLSEPMTTLFVTYGGHQLNLAEAVGAHPFAQQAACAPWTSQKLKRQLVRTAILLARPVRT